MPIERSVAVEVGNQLIHVVKKVEAIRTHSPKPHRGLEPSSYPLMFVLNRGPARISALAEMVHSDVSTVSRQVSNLVSFDLAQKITDPDDGRAQQVALTQQGKDLLDNIREVRGAWLENMLQDWDNQDAQAFSEYLHRFATELGHTLDRIRRHGDDLPDYSTFPNTSTTSTTSRKDAS